MLDFKYMDCKTIAKWTTTEMNNFHYPNWINIQADSFRKSINMPMTIRRAKALCDIMKNVRLHFCPGELLVGSWKMINEETGDDKILENNSRFLESIGCRGFQASFDHHCINYPELLKEGIGGILHKAKTVFNNETDTKKKTFLESVIIVLNGISNHFIRWSEELLSISKNYPEYSELMNHQSKMLKKLSKKAPETYWEALQLITMLNLSVFGCDNRFHMAFGRLDQYLYPFYKNDIENKIMSETEAQTIMDHFFAKIADDDTQVRNIELGGVTREGNDAVNPLTYIILEACKRIGKPGGNLTARINTINSDSYVQKCVEVIKTGIGYPSVYNDNLEIEALCKWGYPIEDARDYCQVGCIEVQISGKHAPWSDSRFDTPKCINYVLRDGFDNILGKYIGMRCDISKLTDWNKFYSTFKEQMTYCFANEMNRVMTYKQIYDSEPEKYTSPLLSAFTDDCINRGKDICDGGSVYPNDHGVGVMGIGTTADCLAALKKFVYDEKIWTLDYYVQMLDANFEGYEEERKKILTESPKYGNDIDEVDYFAKDVAKFLADTGRRYKTPQGGNVLCLMAANTNNVYSGRETGATPDGRLAFEPISDAASPTFGRDKNGATASIRSTSKIDYTNNPAGNVINMRLDPSVLKGDKGVKSVVSLIRSCFALGGIELQFNTNSKETLEKAMAEPEKYEDLVVRVSGFSSKYVNLERGVQEDILARTTHYSL
ncbi:MAG: hypothetical protein KBT47_08090 [Armatimonadetes bacterium]|nr:hypothetical protein [Candidatus Hippobium faecium]